MVLAPELRAVFFDLDGTLLDTAPDMVAELNLLLAEESQQPVDYKFARSHVSNGALGLLSIAFGQMNDRRQDHLRNRFLEIYATRVSQATTLFPGMSDVLKHLESTGVIWGIVTNKPASLTEPLLEDLALLQRCACVISGDTLPERKPHPKPLLHAANMVGVPAEHAVYVGDAERDIQAGKTAGMTTVVATYGYIEPGIDPADWRADHTIEKPRQLLNILQH